LFFCGSASDSLSTSAPEESISRVLGELAHQPCIGPAFEMKDTMNPTNHTTLHDRRAALSRLRTANDAISVLVSALAYQVSARTENQQTCDYCGEQYPAPGPMAWASHNCRVLTTAENIISECVQHLLRERFVVKRELERYFESSTMFLGRSA